MVDYDKIYSENRDFFGSKPSKWVVKIQKYASPPAKVLDLGIGQGRNAIYLASKGYSVMGVDYSKIGIEQCMEKAKLNKVKINCVCADLAEYKIEGEFDVIYSTATLHFLGNRNIIERVISEMKMHTRFNGINIISAPTETKIAMKFPYYFKREELADYYRDWEIIESAEVENKFSNGGLGTVAFIIARKR